MAYPTNMRNCALAAYHCLLSPSYIEDQAKSCGLSRTPSLLQNLLQSLDRAIHHTGHFGFFNGNVTFKVGIEVYAHVLTIFPAAILGLFCGAFAVVFSKLNLAIARWRAQVIKPKDVYRLAEVLVVTIVYIGVCMLLPHLFPCRSSECTVPKDDPTAEPTCPSALVHSNDTLITTNEDLALVRPLSATRFLLLVPVSFRCELFDLMCRPFCAMPFNV
jgi:hypothetical protein